MCAWERGKGCLPVKCRRSDPISFEGRRQTVPQCVGLLQIAVFFAICHEMKHNKVGQSTVSGQTWPNYEVCWPFANFSAVFFAICHETQQLSRAINCFRANMAKLWIVLGFCRFLCCVLATICQENTRAINYLRATVAKLWLSALAFCGR